MAMTAAAILAGLLASAPTPSPPPTPSAPELVSRAAALRARGELEESLALMRQAHALDPSPVLLNNIGALLEALGRYREAVGAYQDVLSHPATPPELRAQDRQRLERLSSKLASAWLRLEPSGGAEAWVDGVAVELGAELEVPAGARRIELWTPGTRELRWIHQRVPSGELTVIKAEAPPDLARLDLTQLGFPLEALELDGYLPRGTSRAPLTIALSSGHHTLRWRVSGEAPVERALDLAPGTRHRLADDPALRRAETPLEVVAAPPREEASAWPLVALGAGAALLGAGAGLGLAAGADRDLVRGAARDPSGVIIGLSYAQAGALESEANTKANASAALFITGATTFAVGALWWLIEHHAL